LDHEIEPIISFYSLVTRRFHNCFVFVISKKEPL